MISRFSILASLFLSVLLLVSGAALAKAPPPDLDITLTGNAVLADSPNLVIRLDTKMTNNTAKALQGALVQVVVEDISRKSLGAQFKSLGKVEKEAGRRSKAPSKPIPLAGVEADAAKPAFRSDIQFIRLEPPLAAGQNANRSFEIVLPAGVTVEQLAGGGVMAFQVIAPGEGAELLGNPLVPVAERERLARELSLLEGLRYQYLDDKGSWVGAVSPVEAEKVRLEALPIAAVEKQTVGGPGFEARRTGGDKTSIFLQNAAHQTITVSVAGYGDTRTHIIEAGGSRTMELEPGLYSFFASSPGVIPSSGSKNWQQGNGYTWTFSIVTSY